MTQRIRVAWHTWEPGLYGNAKTSAGGARWTKFLWKKLRKFDIEVVDISKTLRSQQFDVAVLCWRWQFPHEVQYAERNAIFEKQMRLIEAFKKNSIPILVHDQDYKMTESDRELIGNSGIITEPALHPKVGSKTLMFPYPFGKPIGTSLRPLPVAYIGNNYERYDQFVRYFGGDWGSTSPLVYGNWLIPSSLRESPEKVKADAPSVQFPGRLEQESIIDKLSRTISTIHLAKPEYCDHGFITIRWAEAVAAKCVGFIPNEFAKISLLEDLYVSPENFKEQVKRVKDDYVYRNELLTAQYDFVSTIMNVRNWAVAIKSLV